MEAQPISNILGTETTITPEQYGVGARFSLAVYDSDYVRIILEALESANSEDLVVETNDISTFITGSEQRILEYLRDVISAAAASGAHVGANILLSRGCPGELQCELPPGVAALAAEPVRLDLAGQRARAHWSLYPLLDSASSDLTVLHMDPIYAAIARVREEGIVAGSDHYATRLDADLSRVLQSATNAWIEVGRTVQHVVTHLTISMNSPTVITD